MERPLRSVPIPALIALHRGIEKLKSLGSMQMISSDGRRCALGATGETYLDIANATMDLDLYKEVQNSSQTISRDLEMNLNRLFTLTMAGEAVMGLNDSFPGNQRRRREFMLRHIVEELRQRGLSVNKPAGIKNSDPERVAIRR